MPELFSILLKINVALVLFCAGYYLVLRKLTFYTLNRAYLVTAIIFSSIYPFVDLANFAQRHRDMVEPVQNVVIIWKAPAENLIKQAAYWNWLEALFWTGAIILAMRLMSQMFSLYNIYRRSDEREINGQKVRIVKGDISPFSFWQSIFINPDKLSPTDLQNVLEHEQVHVKEWHTLDILLSEISVIFYWFNPGVWMMKRAVRENIEFITDRKILQQGVDSRAYQYSLLNVSFNQPAPAALTSNFNFSTLKKRIKMMNAQRSSKLNLTRYALLVPVVVVCLFAFSLSKAETVNNNTAIKTIANATIKTLDNLSDAISLPADTTPVKKITRTITITTETTDKPNKTVNITTKDWPTGKADSVLNGLRVMTTRLIGRNSINADSITSITIDGKKATKEELMKVMPDISNRITVLPGLVEGGVVVNGKPLNTTMYSYSFGQPSNSINNNVFVTGGQSNYNHSFSINRDSARNFRLERDSAMSVIGVTGYRMVNDSLRRTLTFNMSRPNTNGEVVVTGYGNSSLSLASTQNASGINSTFYKGKLIIINGKIAAESELKKIAISDIEETISLQGKTAVKYYGEKAKNGAIIITTKKK